MQYFFHKTSMADNPKVESLIEEFGAVGYAIYCRFLEDLCRHGHVEITVTDGDPREVLDTTWVGEVSIQSIAKKLRLEEAITEKVIKRIFGRFDIKIRKKTKYFVILTNTKVIEIMDEYTRRVVRKALTEAKCPDNVRIVSGQTPVNVRQEGKGREKKDLKTDHGPQRAAPPPKAKVKTEGGTKAEEERVKELAVHLINKFGEKEFNPAKFMNMTVKRADGCLYPLEVYIRVFEGLVSSSGVKKPWPYAQKIFNIEKGNVQEEKMVQAHNKFKEAEKGFADTLGLGDLVGGME